MKTLKDHVILYDAVCPMCNLYTKGFIKTGMMEENGRLPYQNMPDNLTSVVDQKRSVNEIALVHLPSGTVYYGIESLLRIIGNSFPILKSLFRCRPFIKIADKLYKFISFNRRVMVPSKTEDTFTGNMDPSFHMGYRLAYLLFSWLVTAFVLYKYSWKLTAILPESNLYREFWVCGGQLAWQGLVMFFLGKSRIWDYLGNMMTISLAGALLLCVVMVGGKLFQLTNPFLYAGMFGLVVTLMLFEHVRRTKLLNLDWRITLSWVLYRILVLLIVLSPAYV